ncbi:leucine-rich repeat-containing protein, putative [Ricinus communis]|uniref:Leucine-rich repeat-containing protein, putative n=1 Tax=Ricinus communis TaxID=3988 RepID=B9SHQ7_RICCO|nr:leucine-rich repeat-containing protein, putative [Ricinus communis]
MAAGPADFLVSKIMSLIENEAALLGSAHDELEEIKRELLSMRSFLEDTDIRRPQTEGKKTWVASVRDLVYDVEDIIDEFMYHMTSNMVGTNPQDTLQDLWLPQMSVGKASNCLQAAKDQRSGSSSSDSYRGMIHEESSLFVKDDELVGIEDERELVIGWLTNGEQQRVTVLVVGMVGSGKTTLAVKAYNCQIVKHHFDCYAWVTVSQAYVIEDLFRSLIKQFYQAAKEAVPMELSSMNYHQLVEMLVNYLEPKRYVGSHVHHNRPLSQNESWALFCMKAFSRYGNKCPSELEVLAEDIVTKCQGLPLAIVSLGGLLSARSSISEWMTVCNTDYEIKRKKLIRLWMAEEFVEQVRRITPEQVAEGYLLELIRRNMLQVIQRNSFGLLKACKMRDMLRALALSISEKEKFCTVDDEQKVGAREEGIVRRLSIQAIEQVNKHYGGMSQLRSLFLFVSDVLHPFSLDKLSYGFKLLRVLELEDAPIEKLPNDIVILFNLRYLNLKRTFVKELPKSIGRLQNLEALNIDDTNIEALPKGIVKLQNLRRFVSTPRDDKTSEKYEPTCET